MDTESYVEPGSILDKLEELIGHMRKPKTVPFDVPWYHSGSGKTDGSGNVSEIRLGELIPVGKVVRIYRMILWADGYTPGAAYSNVASWVGIYNGPGSNPGALEDFAPESDGSQVWPSRAAYNRGNAPLFKGGEQCYVSVFSGPPNTNVTITARGRLEEV